MPSAWERLERAGVPCRPASREKPDLDDVDAVASATLEVLAQRSILSERQRVSLLAWLRAWSSSFPSSFAGAFGAGAAQVLAEAADGVEDVGRYLKLRRIVREKLLDVL